MTETTTDPTPADREELIGHTSPETAYLVADYPYGFRLRTEIRYWIETKKGKGQRVMSQTRDPKRPGRPWNKPKGSIYNAVKALYRDKATGHVENMGISAYDSEEKISAFRNTFPLTCHEERNRQTIEILIARCRAFARVTYTVTSGDEAKDAPRQTPQEQAEIMRKLTMLELKKLRDGGEGGAE